jgi:TRAP-type mannitol/chloroaromatic compound transport system permease small subunit
MSTFLFAGAVMLGGAYTLLHGSHVKMDVVYTRLSTRGRAILDIVTFAVFLFFMVIVIWKSGHVAWKAIEIMEKTESAWGPIIWPARAAITVGTFMLLLQGLAKFIRDILTVAGRGQS